MHFRPLARWMALSVVAPLALAAAAPAAAAEPIVPGDPALPSYSGSQIVGRAKAAAVATTPTPCDNNGSDKSLTRSQVLTRARNWLNTGIPYSQYRCYKNSYGDYRTDCSGFVSMAWGLGGSGSAFWTGNLLTRSSTIARADLRPGDALLRHENNPDVDHVALFVQWADSAHTRPVVIEQTGSRNTVQSTWSQSNASLYKPVRYNNIVEDGTPSNASPDVTGDGFADLVARKPDGTLWLYYNNILRDNGVPYGDYKQVGQGWNDFDRVLASDVTGDGFADLVARKSDGTLWLYSNNILRDNGVPYGDFRQVGQGWAGFDEIVSADVTGDGFADLVARKPDGTLWLYSNNILRDNGVPFGDFRQVGQGWNVFDRIVGADVTGDGYTDLVARKPDGTLWLYSNNILRDNGVPFGDFRQVGQGWNVFDRITA